MSNPTTGRVDDPAESIRPALAADKAAIFRLMVVAGLFREDELAPIEAIFDAAFIGEDAGDRRWIVDERDGTLTGAAYYAPEVVSDRVWNLLMIAVLPAGQGRGVGQRLVAHIERELTDQGERILIVETSGAEGFERARRFYTELGFVEEARIRAYYGDGDDKVVFYKALGPA